jgi:hypothetical protein
VNQSGAFVVGLLVGLVGGATLGVLIMCLVAINRPRPPYVPPRAPDSE